MNLWIQVTILGEVALAMMLGGLVGLERQAANKPAGFRTHMLVAGAAALLVGVGDVLIDHFKDAYSSAALRFDPVRIIEATIAGIGFLGAGTIFRHNRGDHVEGLTTAASLLLVGGIGIAAALRQIVLSVGVTILVLFVLRGLGWVERRIDGGDSGEA